MNFVDEQDFIGLQIGKQCRKIARTLQDAFAVLANQTGEGAIRDAIRVPPRQPLPAAARVGGGAGGTVRVVHFDANELIADVSVAPPGAWLVYADALHPGWRAFIDERETPIAEANLAFKAIWVPPDAGRIRFRFGQGTELLTSWSVAVFGLVSGIALPAGVAFAAARENRR